MRWSTKMVTETRSTFDNLPDTGYMRQWHIIPDVVPVSSATWWRGIKSGKFPKPVKLSERVTAWRVALHSDKDHADLSYEQAYATATADIADEFCIEFEGLQARTESPQTGVRS
jgi:prophage regulatory protein